MDPSFLNNPIFQSIPKEKQQFLQAFAARSHTGTANELASRNGGKIQGTDFYRC